MSKTVGPLTTVLDPEEMVGCPYDESHRTSRAKSQFHLVKCRKANPNIKKVSCIFNATHMINEQEFECHLEECSDRGSLDTFKYVTTIATPVAQPLPEPYIPPAEENWDDVNYGTYEPAKKVAENPLINSHALVTKSEKKTIKHRERNKFRQLDGGHPVETPSPSHQNQDPLTDYPLRAPKSTSIALQSSSAKPLLVNQSSPEKSLQHDLSTAPSDNISSSFANLALGAIPKQIPENSDDFIVVKQKSRAKKLK